MPVLDAVAIRSVSTVVPISLENAHGVLGIEIIAAAQALDFRDFRPGAGTDAARAAVRELVEHLYEDRPLHTDHNNMAAAIKSCSVLEAVEREIGELGSSWEPFE